MDRTRCSQPPNADAQRAKCNASTGASDAEGRSREQSPDQQNHGERMKTQRPAAFPISRQSRIIKPLFFHLVLRSWEFFLFIGQAAPDDDHTDRATLVRLPMDHTSLCAFQAYGTGVP